MKESARVEQLLREAKKAVQEKASDKAVHLLTQALAINPEDIACLDLLGFVYFFQKRYSESEACCRKVLDKKPSHAYALLGLGMNLSRTGQLEKGIKYLRQAMAIQPGWPEPYWDLAIVLKEANHYDEALDVLKEGMIHCKGSKTRFEGLISLIKEMK